MILFIFQNKKIFNQFKSDATEYRLSLIKNLLKKDYLFTFSLVTFCWNLELFVLVIVLVCIFKFAARLVPEGTRPESKFCRDHQNESDSERISNITMSLKREIKSITVWYFTYIQKTLFNPDIHVWTTKLNSDGLRKIIYKKWRSTPERVQFEFLRKERPVIFRKNEEMHLVKMNPSPWLTLVSAMRPNGPFVVSTVYQINIIWV